MKKPSALHHWRLALLFATTLPFSALPQWVTADEKPVPKGLAASDWSAIQQAHEAKRHEFQPQAEGRYAALNPGQNWHLEFDGQRFLARPQGEAWTWGLALRSYGFAGQETSLSGQAPMSAQGQRLSYAWDEMLEEWFINDTRGLEQGWTFHRRPEGTGKLQLTLAVQGGLSAQVMGDGRSVSFVNDEGNAVLTYGGLKAWDAKGRALAVHFTPLPEGLMVEVDESQAQYPITIDPVAQQAYLKASNTGAADNFGWAVAMSGDTVVVGALFESSSATGVNGNASDNSATNAGAVYVYVRSNGSWVQQAYVKASNTEAEDRFGYAVAISGNTLVVGATHEDGNATGVNGVQAEGATDAGAAYVFVRIGTTWVQQAYLKASNTGAGDAYGNTVSISGDTVVVGAPLEDGSASGINGVQDDLANNTGATYVYVRSGGAWSQQAYLKASNPDWNDWFGHAAAVTGETVVVTALQEGSNATGVNGNQANNGLGAAGAAYVFVRSSGIWTQQAYLKASNTGNGDFFGRAVAADGNTIVVGAYYEDSSAIGVNGSEANDSAANAGAAYVYARSGSTWTQQAYLKATNTEADDQFGAAVAISGDTVVIGAAGEDSIASGVKGDGSNNGASSAGAAYVFTRNRSAWTAQSYLKASNTINLTAQFGVAVAVSGNQLVVGANRESSDATGVNGDQNNSNAFISGAAYLFQTSPSLYSLAKTGVSAPGAVDIAFGAAGSAALSEAGTTLFDQGVTGSGASAGRSRAVFSTHGNTSPTELTLQLRDDVSAFGDGLPVNSKAASVLLPLANRSASGALFQATFTGTGLTAANNRALLRDNGSTVSLLRRLGQPVPELGGAVTSAFLEVLQSLDSDIAAISYRLKLGGPSSITASYDSGVFPITSTTGALLVANPAVIREGGLEYGNTGLFGQFTGRAVAGQGNTIHFGAMMIPPAPAKPVNALYRTTTDGVTTGLSAQQGIAAPDNAGRFYSSFPAVSQSGSHTLFRALITGSTLSNEGLFRSDGIRLMQKGLTVEPVSLPTATLTRILRFWPVGSGQVVVQAQIQGTGITAANNQVLLLRMSDGNFMVLLRTGQAVPGITPATITLAAISAVDVNPVNGDYAVLGSLKGAATTANQAIWTGRTSLGNDGLLKDLRLPNLLLRKGDTYTTASTQKDTIRSLALKPAVDASGAGGRGLAQIVGANGQILVLITGDAKRQELVKVQP